jgi:LPS sulfotransferase NodH
MRICVVALPRSGSSTLCKHLSRVHNLRNTGEIFRRKNGFEVLQRDNIVIKLVPQLATRPAVAKYVQNHYPKYAQAVMTYNLMSDEMFPKFYKRHQEYLFNETISICDQILNSVDEIYFIERKDTKKQILSLAALRQTSAGGRNRSSEVKITDQQLKAATDSYQLTGYTYFKHLLSAYSGKLVYTEDLDKITKIPKYPDQTYEYNSDFLSE